MTDKEKVKSAIQFFREMGAISQADEKGGLTFTDGLCAGKAAAYTVAANHLEKLFSWEEI